MCVPTTVTVPDIYAGSAPMEVDAGKAVEGNLYFKNNCNMCLGQSTLVKELKGTAPIHCSIAELHYPKRGLTLMSANIGIVTLLSVHFDYLCLRL